MTYTLYIGDFAYSSWSLRGWLLFERFGIPCQTRSIDFNLAPVAEQLRDLAPARTVPACQIADGPVLTDSLALAEELASRHPDAGLWPKDPDHRAIARNLTAEMHSGFTALRTDCPMHLRLAYAGFDPSDAVRADVTRLEELWAHARGATRSDGPWLCGAYSAADAFFAPVAARIATYDLPVGADAAQYVAAHLTDPAFRRWRAMGFASGATLQRYAREYDHRPWPGPVSRPAKAADSGADAVNSDCLYSGKPATHFLSYDGKTYGFCNAFCRDKTVADPEVWPAFMEAVRAAA